MPGKILVVGATGKTGSELVKALVEKGERVKAATRNPADAAARLGPSVEAVGFDFEQPRTFGPALEGADRLFLMARPGDPRPHEAAAPLVDEARKRGVRLIVDLTAVGVEKNDAFPLRVLERHIEESGIACSHLRPNWFMQNFSSGTLLADIRATGAIRLPAGEARISFIDVRDIAAVAADALTEARHAGRAWTLTGGEALDHHQVAAALSGVAGRTITYVPIGDDDARRAMAGQGWSREMIERQVLFFGMVRAGFCEPVSGDVGSVLGRQPISFERYAADHAFAWT